MPRSHAGQLSEAVIGPASKRTPIRAEWVPRCPSCDRPGRGIYHLRSDALLRVDHGSTRAGAISFCTRAPRRGALLPVRLGPEETDPRGQAEIPLQA